MLFSTLHVCCPYGYYNDTFVKQAPLQRTPKIKAPLERQEIKWRNKFRTKLIGKYRIQNYFIVC